MFTLRAYNNIKCQTNKEQYSPHKQLKKIPQYEERSLIFVMWKCVTLTFHTLY